MLKVNHVGFGFALIHSVIDYKNSCHFLNQTEVKLKPMMSCSDMFSHTGSQLRVFASSSDWFIVLFLSLVIG